MQVFDSKGDHVYLEMCSGHKWSKQQVSTTFRCQFAKLFSPWVVGKATLKVGMTLLGIILASDKMHLTNYSGDKSMHAIYMSLGNIHKDV